ncbi:Nramp family divalent metal transporter [Geobacillus jurassicus]|uniref:Nramp family divalent metal transporter n=1 Tax=Geobacillus jurassicus TaxID=235932 RepID=A0ABV6GSQ5_9BACL
MGKSKWTMIVPRLIVAATGVGAGDLVAALVAGTNYGLVFMWAIIVGAVFKFVLNEGGGRWHLLSGKTSLPYWQSTNCDICLFKKKRSSCLRTGAFPFKSSSPALPIPRTARR